MPVLGFNNQLKGKQLCHTLLLLHALIATAQLLFKQEYPKMEQVLVNAAIVTRVLMSQ